MRTTFLGGLTGVVLIVLCSGTVQAQTRVMSGSHGGGGFHGGGGGFHGGGMQGAGPHVTGSIGRNGGTYRGGFSQYGHGGGFSQYGHGTRGFAAFPSTRNSDRMGGPRDPVVSRGDRIRSYNGNQRYAYDAMIPYSRRGGMDYRSGGYRGNHGRDVFGRGPHNQMAYGRGEHGNRGDHGHRGDYGRRGGYGAGYGYGGYGYGYGNNVTNNITVREGTAAAVAASTPGVLSHNGGTSKMREVFSGPLGPGATAAATAILMKQGPAAFGLQDDYREAVSSLPADQRKLLTGTFGTPSSDSDMATTTMSAIPRSNARIIHIAD